tara:strand:- start:63 stop:1358 length:1296 start_codon:yes stop_codon:yes gene_type:complete
MSIGKMYNLGKKLFPICRSITGNGNRKTLRIIKKYLPKLKIHEVRSGSKVFDWKVPPEWNIKEAYVLDKFNRKIIDFKNNNLHLVGYSIPINKNISKKELFSHIHTLPKQPKAIPYVTSYYKKNWGFCISYKEKIFFKKKYKNNDKFKVVINSSLKKSGKLTYADLVIPGKSKQEILISTYICHPSMANNELSGLLVSTALAKYFSSKKNQKTLRFIFVPETIGSITYLSKNLNILKEKVIAGYNLSCIGDERKYSYLSSKYGNTISDKSVKKAFKNLKIKYISHSFLQRGSDERQYNSPGIDLPIASIFRTKYGEYPEYHTSLDNFNVVTKKGLQGGYKVVKEAVDIIMKNTYPKSVFLCEPQMSKRGLYPYLSKFDKGKNKFTSKNYLNFLQYADGTNDLNDISKYIKFSFGKTYRIFKLMLKSKLIKS